MIDKLFPLSEVPLSNPSRLSLHNDIFYFVNETEGVLNVVWNISLVD